MNHHHGHRSIPLLFTLLLCICHFTWILLSITALALPTSYEDKILTANSTGGTIHNAYFRTAWLRSKRHPTKASTNSSLPLQQQQQQHDHHDPPIGSPPLAYPPCSPCTPPTNTPSQFTPVNCRCTTDWQSGELLCRCDRAALLSGPASSAPFQSSPHSFSSSNNLPCGPCGPPIGPSPPQQQGFPPPPPNFPSQTLGSYPHPNNGPPYMVPPPSPPPSMQQQCQPTCQQNCLRACGDYSPPTHHTRSIRPPPPFQPPPAFPSSPSLSSYPGPPLNQLCQPNQCQSTCQQACARLIPASPPMLQQQQQQQQQLQQSPSPSSACVCPSSDYEGGIGDCYCPGIVEYSTAATGAANGPQRMNNGPQCYQICADECDFGCGAGGQPTSDCAQLCRANCMQVCGLYEGPMVQPPQPLAERMAGVPMMTTMNMGSMPNGNTGNNRGNEAKKMGPGAGSWVPTPPRLGPNPPGPPSFPPPQRPAPTNSLLPPAPTMLQRGNSPSPSVYGNGVSIMKGAGGSHYLTSAANSHPNALPRGSSSTSGTSLPNHPNGIVMMPSRGGGDDIGNIGVANSNWPSMGGGTAPAGSTMGGGGGGQQESGDGFLSGCATRCPESCERACNNLEGGSGMSCQPACVSMCTQSCGRQQQDQHHQQPHDDDSSSHAPTNINGGGGGGSDTPANGNNNDHHVVDIHHATLDATPTKRMDGTAASAQHEDSGSANSPATTLVKKDTVVSQHDVRNDSSSSTPTGQFNNSIPLHPVMMFNLTNEPCAPLCQPACLEDCTNRYMEQRQHSQSSQQLEQQHPPPSSQQQQPVQQQNSRASVASHFQRTNFFAPSDNRNPQTTINPNPEILMPQGTLAVSTGSSDSATGQPTQGSTPTGTATIMLNNEQQQPSSDHDHHQQQQQQERAVAFNPMAMNMDELPDLMESTSVVNQSSKLLELSRAEDHGQQQQLSKVEAEEASSHVGEDGGGSSAGGEENAQESPAEYESTRRHHPLSAPFTDAAVSFFRQTSIPEIKISQQGPQHPASASAAIQSQQPEGAWGVLAPMQPPVMIPMMYEPLPISFSAPTQEGIPPVPRPIVSPPAMEDQRQRPDESGQRVFSPRRGPMRRLLPATSSHGEFTTAAVAAVKQSALNSKLPNFFDNFLLRRRIAATAKNSVGQDGRSGEERGGVVNKFSLEYDDNSGAAHSSTGSAETITTEKEKFFELREPSNKVGGAGKRDDLNEAIGSNAATKDRTWYVWSMFDDENHQPADRPTAHTPSAGAKIGQKFHYPPSPSL